MTKADKTEEEDKTTETDTGAEHGADTGTETEMEVEQETRTESRTEPGIELVIEHERERVTEPVQAPIPEQVNGYDNTLSAKPDRESEVEPGGELSETRNGQGTGMAPDRMSEPEASLRRRHLTGSGADRAVTPTSPPLPPPPTDTPDGRRLSQLSATQDARLLYEALQSADLPRFSTLLTRCAGQPSALDYSHGIGLTCLQYACDRRLTAFVDLLLEAGADPCVTSPASGRTALHWAAARDAGILQRVLERAPPSAVNARDALRCTPLHHAVQAGCPAAIGALLRAGADVSARDDLGQPLLHSLPPDVLEEFLNSCVSDGRDAGGAEEFAVQFDYALMWPRLPTGRARPETAAVFHMAESEEHCHLLRHPLVRSFLDLKWWAASALFVADLVYYFVFLALLTALILIRVERYQLGMVWSEVDLVVKDFYWATVLITVPMVVTQALQFLAAPVRYLFQWEAFLVKVPLLLTTAAYLLKGASLTLDYSTGPQVPLSSILLLFAWVQLFVLLSRMPFFAIYAKMYTTVFVRFLWFLLWYGVVIAGFAISLYIVFRDREDSDDYDLSTLGLTLLRTVVMVLDKMDINYLPLQRCKRNPAGQYWGGKWECLPSGDPSAAQLALVLCLFFVTVVLTNLLNGLAISDTAALRSHAVAVSLAARARLLHRIDCTYRESSLREGPLRLLGLVSLPLGLRCDSAPARCLTALGGLCGLRARLARWLAIRRRLSDGRLWVFPDRARDKTWPPLPGYWWLDEEVLERARALVLLRSRGKPQLELQVSRLERQLDTQLSDMGC